MPAMFPSHFIVLLYLPDSITWA